MSVYWTKNNFTLLRLQKHSFHTLEFCQIAKIASKRTETEWGINIIFENSPMFFQPVKTFTRHTETQKPLPSIMQTKYIAKKSKKKLILIANDQ